MVMDQSGSASEGAAAKGDAQDANPIAAEAVVEPVVEPGAPAPGRAGSPVVLQLTPGLDGGGVERGTIEIAQALTAAGGTALVASRGGRLESALTRAGGRLIKLEVGHEAPWAIRRNAKALARIIRDEGVEIVHARSRAPAWAGWYAAKETGVPFVTTWHGVYKENAPLKSLWNGIMSRGRPVIAVSDFIAQMIRARHPEAEIVVIPRGADLAAFDPAAISGARTAALAERWGLVEDARPVVMLPGRLTRWKGQAHFIEAAAKLRAIRGADDFLFLMVGGELDSPYAQELSALIRKRGVEGCCALAGHCEDMAAGLKLASAVVSASLEPEAFGRVAVEAQAMGRPIIATDHGGARETVEDGVTGWRYPPGDAEALAQAAQRALTLDDSGREHMGLAGRARILQRFSTEGMQRATLEVYERVLARG